MPFLWVSIGVAEPVINQIEHNGIFHACHSDLIQAYVSIDWHVWILHIVEFQFFLDLDSSYLYSVKEQEISLLILLVAMCIPCNSRKEVHLVAVASFYYFHTMFKQFHVLWINNCHFWTLQSLKMEKTGASDNVNLFLSAGHCSNGLEY